MAFYPFTGGLTSALRGTGTSPLVGVGTSGDTVNRAELDADGGLRFGSGSGAVDTSLLRSGVGALTLSNLLTVNGLASLNSGVNISGFCDVNAVGKGLAVAEGANAKQGTAVLVAGTVTVANTSVTANSRILLTTQTPGGTAGFLVVSARVAGTSFTILSSNAADTSTVAYEIFEPG